MNNTDNQRVHLLGIFLLLLTLTGCFSNPQSASEFLKTDSIVLKNKAFQIKRDFQTLAKDVNNFAIECLDVLVTTSYPGTMYSTGGFSVEPYNPRVIVKDNSIKLILQIFLRGSIKIYKEPSGGAFVLVAEMKEQNKDHFDVTIKYIFSRDKLVDGFEKWIKGEDDLCPVLSD